MRQCQLLLELFCDDGVEDSVEKEASLNVGLHVLGFVALDEARFFLSQQFLSAALHVVLQTRCWSLWHTRVGFYLETQNR